MASSAALRLNNLRRHLDLDLDHTANKAAGVNSVGASLNVKVAQEVSEALSLGRAVVALESTIISHGFLFLFICFLYFPFHVQCLHVNFLSMLFFLGMPYPQNLETAKAVEAIVRENGAVPATIAILDGVPRIGLSGEELERLAILGTKAQKTARRDIAYVVARGGNGATTVSGTMFLASMVGIHIFVTGGMGGVHRQGEYTMDISSDLTHLGRTPIAVICAGVKSILDIPRTLEYLETQGVCVAAYKTNEFPAFFTASSGCMVPCRVDTPEECASLIEANTKLKLGSGILIGVPIPQEHSTSGHIIESAIKKALEEAKFALSFSFCFLITFCILYINVAY
ncbi:hypothetical protein RYX36_012401 [Vicia faba]